MLKFSFTKVDKEEQIGQKKGSTKTTTAYTYEDAEVEDLAQEIKKLLAEGYDVTAKLTLKIPK